MYLNKTEDIVKKANEIVQKVGSRNPEEIASQLGIIIAPCHFSQQKGVYKVIKKSRFIFVKEDLCPELRVQSLGTLFYSMRLGTMCYTERG
jgi:hypothetical protein